MALADLILDTEEMLYGPAQVERPYEDTLKAAVAADSTVAWQFVGHDAWRRGDLAEAVTPDGSVGEIVVMAQDHPDDADVLVRRSQRRTTAAGGFSAGDVFRKGSLYPRVLIARAVNETIDNDLAPDVWYRTQRSFTPVVGTRRYDLAAADFNVEDMWQVDINSTTNYNPMPNAWWEVITNQDSTTTATGKTLRIKRWFSDSDDVYYTARTYPLSSAIASLPQDIQDMVPWGAMSRLMAMGAAAGRMDAARSQRVNGEVSPSQPYADARYFQTRFEEMKARYKRKMFREKMPQKRYRGSSMWRG
jgi:hypothetical protein